MRCAMPARELRRLRELARRWLAFGRRRGARRHASELAPTSSAMYPLERRRFDHLATELSVALGVLVPRHALWLAAARELASAERVAAFCGAALDAFLATEQLRPPAARERARLRRAVAGFDAARRSPEEILAALFGASASH